MHQCLCIEDILRVVFDCVDEHEYDPTRWIYVRQEHALRTLAALSHTCRTFKDPALDVLWREIPGVPFPSPCFASRTACKAVLENILLPDVHASEMSEETHDDGARGGTAAAANPSALVFV